MGGPIPPIKRLSDNEYFERGAFLIGLSAVFGYLNHQVLRLPHTIGRVMNGMLSFLLFAGAMHVDFSAFRTRSQAIGLMATMGVMISTFVIGWGSWLLLNAFGIEIPLLTSSYYFRSSFRA